MKTIMSNLGKFHYITFVVIILISGLTFILLYGFKLNGIGKGCLYLFSSAIMILLIIEVFVVIIQLYDYLFKKVFSSPAEHSDRIITELCKEYALYDETSDLDKKVNNILTHDGFTKILKKNSISTILYFLFYLFIIFLFQI